MIIQQNCQVKNDDSTSCTQPAAYRVRIGTTGWIGVCGGHFTEHTQNGNFSGYEFKAI